MSKLAKKDALRLKRKKRIRTKISGSALRPRLSIFRSPRHVYAQVINDDTGMTLASISSFNKGKVVRCGVDECVALGKELAQKCAAKQITKVLFDKNGYAFHGRVKAFADGAREGGLEF